MSTETNSQFGASSRFAVAPMMDWTDRHCRYFHRLLSRRALLYTEMVTADAVVFGDRARLLAFDPAEHPLALQLGGSDPKRLGEAARIGADLGFNEINLNVGCPSDRVQSGRFGACLMAEPDLVAECFAAMQAAASVPVTVKCRIGIDEMDVEQGLDRFADAVASAGCTRLIVHARKAWLEGLSPKQNREVPPLDYGRVYRLKARLPELTVIVNGGIESLGEAAAHLARVDGVMVGRAAYHNPYLLAGVDRELMGSDHGAPPRQEVVMEMLPYVERHIAAGGRLHQVTRHMLGLFQGLPGARRWRRHLSEAGCRPGAGVEVLREALAQVAPSQAAAE